MNLSNNVQLIGNLGADPKINVLDGGKKVANLSLATTDTWKDNNGEKQSKTEWHSLSAWDGLAEVAEKYLKKGSKIIASGKLTYKDYVDGDNIKRKSTIVQVNNILMLDKKDNN